MQVSTSMLAFDGGAFGLRNRVINGGMRIDQRNAGAAQTITAGAALAYTVDRFYAYCTGANVTGQQVAASNPQDFTEYRFTGAASVTAIGFGHRIERQNTGGLQGQTCTLSVDLANSLLTSVNWAVYYANTNDTFGTVASPTRTLIASGTFTVNSTKTRYSATMSVPAAATTGIEIVFTVGAQTSGTWTIDDVQFEQGVVATPFERRPIGFELGLCQRYYQTSSSNNFGLFWSGNTSASVTYYATQRFAVSMRTSPTVTLSNYNVSGFPASLSLGAGTAFDGFRVDGTANSAGNANYFSASWAATAEL